METEKVKITASAVRVGDIVRAVSASPTTGSIVLSVRSEQLPAESVMHVHVWEIAGRQAHAFKIPAAVDVTVERYVAPARVSDDELGQLVEVALSVLESDRAALDPVLSPARRLVIERIVDRIMPPVAPTLAEALEMLQSLTESGRSLAPSLDLLERARKSGAWPIVSRETTDSQE